MLNSRQRAQLRGLANSFETILQVGKSGVTENTVKQVVDALEARELIKLRTLETCPTSPRETAEEIAEKTGVTQGYVSSAIKRINSKIENEFIKNATPDEIVSYYWKNFMDKGELTNYLDVEIEFVQKIDYMQTDKNIICAVKLNGICFLITLERGKFRKSGIQLLGILYLSNDQDNTLCTYGNRFYH